MMYISLVGTQIIAVLNPLLSLMGRNMKPETVVLPATDATMANAQTLVEYLCRNSGFSPEAIQVVPVSNSLETDAKGRPPAHEAIRPFFRANPKIAFNLAGGMNFQIAACLKAISMNRSLFLYPEDKGVHAVEIEEGRISGHDIFPLPDPVDVLKLQGVPHTIHQGQLHSFLKYALKTCGAAIPRGADRHVQIGNVLFDLAWNTTNKLNFLKVIHSSKQSGKKSSDYLKSARDVIVLARNREAFGELYDRNITVLTNNGDLAERISAEGGDKVNVICLHPSMETVDQKNARMKIMRLFGRYAQPVQASAGDKITEETGNPVGSDGAELYVSLGTESMPSLIALWSHRPSRVCFLYTPDNPKVLACRDSILAEKKNLPVQSVSFYPVSVTGTEILDMPKPDTENVQVNITPGTKGHTAFLSLWAGVHGAGVYSVKTVEQQLMEIPQGRKTSLSGPPPNAYLRLTGVNVLSYGEGKGNLLQNRECMETIRDTIRRIAGEDPSLLARFPNEEIRLEGLEFKPRKKKGKFRTVLVQRTGAAQPVECKFDESNEWFEQLVGFVMAECGAEDVQIRLRTRWSPETEKRLKAAYGIEPHMTDIDVVARFQTNYFIISCKASPKKEVGKVTAEANAFASLFGRFTVPMVCFLKHPGEPSNRSNGVYAFGFKTLTDHEAMKTLLQKALNERRKTGGR